jgi:hypothetical protein
VSVTASIAKASRTCVFGHAPPCEVGQLLTKCAEARICDGTNQHSLSVPRMPVVRYVSRDSFLDVSYLGCTTSELTHSSLGYRTPNELAETLRSSVSRWMRESMLVKGWIALSSRS